MTEDEARKELKNYIHNKRSEEIKLERLEEAKAKCEKVTSVISDMPKAPLPNNKSVEENYIRYIDLSNELLEIINKGLEENIIITKKIQQVEQPSRNILDLKYIQGKKVSEIADELGYEFRYTKKLIRKAIRLYSNIKGEYK